MGRRMRSSLARRLALLFALVTVVVFSVAGFHLYHFLNDQLRRQDDLALLGTMEIIRHQLARQGGMEAMHAVINLLHAAHGPEAVVLSIRDSAGNLLIATGPGAESLPIASPLPLDQSPDLDDIRDWIQNGRTRGRIIAAWQRTGGAAEDRVLLALARDVHASAVVLDAHGHEALITLGIGAVIASLLGYCISRRALRPVQAIAKTAERITANQLHARLSAEDAPRELLDMVHAFNLMLDRLEDSFRRLNRFSADLAHDLQTPLGNLMGETQVALSKRRSVPEYEALLASNIEEYERLSRMIRDMLFLAKADNPETEIEVSSVDLRQELDKVVDYYVTLADDERFSIAVRGAGTVVGEPLLIRRAIQNLLSNAIRYGDGRDIEAEIASSEPGYVDLSISNTGPGIEPEHVPYVFDRFYRADSARTRSSEGSGLGLAIVKSIAALHHGEVRVASTPNERTTFVLRLRRDPAPPSSQQHLPRTRAA